MAIRQIAIDRVGDRSIAALVVDGALEDLLVDPLAASDAVPGAIFVAIAERPLKPLGGTVVRLGGSQKGFLRGGQPVEPGKPILVEVSGFPEPGKLPPVRSKPAIKGRYAVATPGVPGINVSRSIEFRDVRDELSKMAEAAAAGAPDGTGFILRSACLEASVDQINGELEALAETARKLACGLKETAPRVLMKAPTAEAAARREWQCRDPRELDDRPGSFERHGVWELVELVRDPEVRLPGGGRMHIEETKALVAVDVDSGASVSRQAGRTANLDAAGALLRELRLRGLGGQVVVDFAPMAKSSRPAVREALASGLGPDRREVDFGGWTPQGNFELRRKRDRQPISRSLPQ